MSIGNRIKLCDGLARAGILGKRFFQKLYPKTNSLTISTEADFEIQGGNISDEIHGDYEKKKSQTYANPSLNAGDVLILKTIKSSTGRDHHVGFEYQMSKIGTIYCEGFTSQWDDAKQDTQYIRILTPLANGYRYTPSIAQHFGFSLTNENVGVYPHCRDV